MGNEKVRLSPVGNEKVRLSPVGNEKVNKVTSPSFYYLFLQFFKKCEDSSLRRLNVNVPSKSWDFLKYSNVFSNKSLYFVKNVQNIGVYFDKWVWFFRSTLNRPP